MQLSYQINIPAASFPGQLADSTRNRIQTAISAAGPVAYGTVVVLDKANSAGQDNAGRAPTSADEITAPGSVLGVAVADQARAQNAFISGPAYEKGVAVSCLYSGKIYVVPEGQVANGDQVYVRHTADGAKNVLGGVANAAGAGLALLPNAVFRSSALAGGYAVLSLNEA